MSVISPGALGNLPQRGRGSARRGRAAAAAPAFCAGRWEQEPCLHPEHDPAPYRPRAPSSASPGLCKRSPGPAHSPWLSGVGRDTAVAEAPDTQPVRQRAPSPPPAPAGCTPPGMLLRFCPPAVPVAAPRSPARCQAPTRSVPCSTQLCCRRPSSGHFLENIAKFQRKLPESCTSTNWLLQHCQPKCS